MKRGPAPADGTTEELANVTLTLRDWVENYEYDAYGPTALMGQAEALDWYRRHSPVPCVSENGYKTPDQVVVSEHQARRRALGRERAEAAKRAAFFTR
jgi:hypothetical protein